MSYFDPTSSERRGLIVLGVALLLATCVGLYSLWHRSEAAPTATVGTTPLARKDAPKYYAVPERQTEAFPFDPNEADSTTLLRLGFAPYQVRGIYKYRALGGRYHEVADVSRIPGMTNELWERLAPNVRIGHKYRYVEPLPRTQRRTAQAEAPAETAVAKRDTINFPVKLTEGTFVALNEADTNQLKKVPGIGSYYARQIVRYREQLGGYVSLAQLQEIDGMPEGVEHWLRLDTGHIRRIDLNHATKNQLVRHPYLRVYRATAIWNHRHSHGPLHGLDDLRALPNFSEADVRRLAPYVLFR